MCWPACRFAGMEERQAAEMTSRRSAVILTWANARSARTPPDLDFYVRLHDRFAPLFIVLELLKGRAKAQHNHSFLLGAGSAHRPETKV
jgi:hypothetical protein